MRPPARCRAAVRACGRETTMPGTPDSTVILHWDECQSAWARLSWRDWVRFRGLDAGGVNMLVGAEAGEPYFRVCVPGERGGRVNGIPHRSVLWGEGGFVYVFAGLGKDGRDDPCGIQVFPPPTPEDSERCDKFDPRGFRVNLPP